MSSEQTASPELRADRPDEFAHAMTYLLESYRGLDDAKSGWIRQKDRELHMMGSDLVTLAYSGLHDRVVSLLDSRNINPEINDQAVHVGIIDGLLFADAYRQLCDGVQPSPIEKLHEYIPVYDPKRHVSRRGADPSIIFSLSSVDDVQQLIDFTTIDESRRVVWSGGVQVIGFDRFIQVGPNEFTTAFEITDELETKLKCRLGFAALAGLAFDSA